MICSQECTSIKYLNKRVHLKCSKGIVKTQAIIDSLKSKGILSVEVDLAKSKLPEPAKEKEPEVTKPVVKPVGRDSINEANELYSSAIAIQSSFLKSLKKWGGKRFVSLGVAVAKPDRKYI